MFGHTGDTFVPLPTLPLSLSLSPFPRQRPCGPCLFPHALCSSSSPGPSSPSGCCAAGRAGRGDRCVPAATAGPETGRRTAPPGHHHPSFPILLSTSRGSATGLTREQPHPATGAPAGRDPNPEGRGATAHHQEPPSLSGSRQHRQDGQGTSRPQGAGCGMAPVPQPGSRGIPSLPRTDGPVAHRHCRPAAGRFGGGVMTQPPSLSPETSSMKCLNV